MAYDRDQAGLDFRRIEGIEDRCFDVLRRCRNFYYGYLSRFVVVKYKVCERPTYVDSDEDITAQVFFNYFRMVVDFFVVNQVLIKKETLCEVLRGDGIVLWFLDFATIKPPRTSRVKLAVFLSQMHSHISALESDRFELLTELRNS
jgi:hypothetical protein